MVKWRSFNLLNEDKNTKQSEVLYQPKHLRWCKFVVIPLLIAFILLLILINVDFSGSEPNKTWLVVQNNTIVISKRPEDRPKRRPIITTRGINCIRSDNSCRLSCHGGNTNNMYQQLEPLYPECGNDLELYLYDCNFPSGAMKAKFLQGSYRLKTLAIIDCNLQSIEENTFAQESAEGIKNLYLINTKLLTLSKTIFAGLIQLEVLNITNQMSMSQFKGEKFLMPIANTLQTLRFVLEGNEIQSYALLEWLQGAELINLRQLNLSGNNFHYTLSEETFANMHRVESLNLANCSLNYLSRGIFDQIIPTLRYLDLSFNQFTTLEVGLMQKLGNLKQLNLTDNEWDCSCNNVEFLKILKNDYSNITNLAALKCSTPVDIKGTSVLELFLSCDQETSNVPSTMEIETTNASDEFNGSASTQSTLHETDTTLTVNDSSDTSETDASQSTSSETSEETTESANTFPTIPTTIESIETTTSTVILPQTSEIPKFTTTTTRTTTTPPTPPYATSTTSAPSHVTISCLDAKQGKSIYVSLDQPQAHFSIYSHTTTSVMVVAHRGNTNFDLLYFTNYTQAQEISKQRSSPNVDYVLLVHDLTPGEAYVFCLVQTSKSSVSPFDCSSYSVRIPEVQAWLLNEDQSWIIALVVVGVCLCIFLGVIVTCSLMCLKNRRKLRRHIQESQAENHRNSGSSGISDRGSVIPLADPQHFGTQPDVVGVQHRDQCAQLDSGYYQELLM